MFARFSPDGKSIAFTGQYDGNTEVYVMPAAGGVPQRLTYTATLSRDDVADRMGPNNIVMTWTPDGKHIIFRSRMHSFNAFLGRLYSVALTGDLPEELPLPRAGFCSFSPDGKKLAYNRVFREFRTWKRYRGGMADDIWVYDFDAKTTENITNNGALDIIPMWKDDQIFFLSDRDGDKRMNLFVYDTKSKETRQLTNFAEFDVKFPSLGKDAIVFENGGYLYRYDIPAGQYAKVDILIEDDLQGGRGGLVSVADKVTNFEIAPDGKRALFGARGDVFTVPAKHGAIRNLTVLARRARPQLQMVAGRQVDRLHLRRLRRGRGLGNSARWSRTRPAGHQRRCDLQVPDRMVARQQEDPLGRQGPAAALRQRRDRRDHRSLQVRQVGVQRVRLVAGQPVDRLHQARSGLHEQDLPLFAQGPDRARADRRLV